MSVGRPSDEATPERNSASKAGDAKASPAAMTLKAAKQLEKAVAGLIEALGNAGDPHEKPFQVLGATQGALSSLKQIGELATALGSANEWLKPLDAEARDVAERSRVIFAGELAEALEPLVLRLQGRLPTLEVGPFTIELVEADRPEVRLHYGPKIELLETIPVDAALVLKAVQRARELIEPGPLNDQAFLAELHAAWRTAMARRAYGPADKVPIADVYAELVFGRQSAAFRAAPQRSGFTAVPRVSFAHDLGRLRHHLWQGKELVLTVATRDQTKKAADHLWVAGTHYAYLGFRENERG
jgi:hypothetical protein